jgi:uncharacterized membrane protein YczE
MNETHKKAQLLRGWIILCIGLEVMALGVSFSITANLGTSPISSLPYVLSLITPLSVGKATIIMHCVLVLLQILILRKKYQPIQLLQLPVAFIFGYLTDFNIWITGHISYSTYWQQWILCIIGIVVIAFGVSLEVFSKTVTLAGEGFCLAVCQVLPIKFGNMKVGFDVTLVVIACILSGLFLHSLQGVREGTVMAAIFVGIIAKQILKRLERFRIA